MFLFLGDFIRNYHVIFLATLLALLKDKLSAALSVWCIIQQLRIRIRNWGPHGKINLPVKIGDLV